MQAGGNQEYAVGVAALIVAIVTLWAALWFLPIKEPRSAHTTSTTAPQPPAIKRELTVTWHDNTPMSDLLLKNGYVIFNMGEVIVLNSYSRLVPMELQLAYVSLGTELKVADCPFQVVEKQRFIKPPQDVSWLISRILAAQWLHKRQCYCAVIIAHAGKSVNPYQDALHLLATAANQQRSPVANSFQPGVFYSLAAGVPFILS